MDLSPSTARSLEMTYQKYFLPALKKAEQLVEILGRQNALKHASNNKELFSESEKWNEYDFWAAVYAIINTG
jgi:hypothetical protein